MTDFPRWTQTSIGQRDSRTNAFIGAESSPSYVRSPEGNGVAERFFRTLKEQLLWIKTFTTVEELRIALNQFRDRYNSTWILERHGYMTPSEVRYDLLARAA